MKAHTGDVFSMDGDRGGAGEGHGDGEGSTGVSPGQGSTGVSPGQSSTLGLEDLIFGMQGGNPPRPAGSPALGRGHTWKWLRSPGSASFSWKTLRGQGMAAVGAEKTETPLCAAQAPLCPLFLPFPSIIVPFCPHSFPSVPLSPLSPSQELPPVFSTSFSRAPDLFIFIAGLFSFLNFFLFDFGGFFLVFLGSVKLIPPSRAPVNE